MSEETPKVVATDADPAAAEKARLKAEHQAQVASTRAGHVSGLENELAYLQRQPTVNTGRVAAVRAELDRYAEKPSQRRQEAAVPSAAPAPAPATPEPVVAPEAPEAPAPAPAKKAAAAKKPAAKRAPAKKSAAKKK